MRSTRNEKLRCLKAVSTRSISVSDGTCNPGGPGATWFKKFLGFRRGHLFPAVRHRRQPFFAGERASGAEARVHGRVLPALRPASGQRRRARSTRCSRADGTCPQTRHRRVYLGGWTTVTPTPRPLCGWDWARRGVWALDEYYHVAGETGARSPRQYARDLVRFARGSECRSSTLRRGFLLQVHEDSPGLRPKRPITPCWTASSSWPRCWTLGG